MDSKDSKNLTVTQLLWQCRRGMLELDMLLIPFLERVYPGLSSFQQKSFELLLKQTDQTLYQWFFGQETCLNVDLNEIVQKIRDYTHQ